jgi:tetratricopeptide (TPR) repeat protein
LQAGRVDEAMGHYAAALYLNPQIVNAQHAHLKLGMYFLRRNRPVEANAHLARAIEIDPNLTEPVQEILNLHEKGQLPPEVPARAP